MRHDPAEPLTRPRWLDPALILLAVSLLGLSGYLASELLEGESFAFDRYILLALRRPGHLNVPIGPVWLQQSAIDISALGGFTLMWLAGGTAIALFVRAGRHAQAAWLALSLIGASMLDALLKQWLHRPRPDIVPHLARVTSASFPSGHAMIAATVYLTLALMIADAWPRTRRIAVVLAVTLVVLIGVSRVYLGVHWPSDVLAGWSLGIVWAVAVLAAVRATHR